MIIDSFTNCAIWAATQNRSAERLSPNELLFDPSKSKSLVQKGIIHINCAIKESTYSELSKKVLLSLVTVICVVSFVAHLALYIIGSLGLLLDTAIGFVKGTRKDPFRSLVEGSVTLVASPGLALWATIGSVILQVRTVQSIQEQPQIQANSS